MRYAVKCNSASFFPQNFASIGQYGADINNIAANLFSGWRVGHHGFVKKFGHPSDIGIKVRISRPNFFEIGLWLRYSDINIFKREAIRHLEFFEICYFIHSSCVCFTLQNFVLMCRCGKKKTIFKMASSAVLDL